MTTVLGMSLIKIAIRFEPDIVTARQKTRRLSALLGFDTQDQARLATAVSELARNFFQYAGQGHVEFYFNDSEPQALFIKAYDSGPGIKHLEEILNGTYKSETGMGVGLIGTKKLMDHFDIETHLGKGTVVTIGKNLDKRAKRVKKQDLPRIAESIISKPAESPFEEIQNQNRDLLAALEDARSAKAELNELNRELAETNRGVVALYAELDEKAESLQKANEIKTSFLSNMTHEFRTPLSSVISLTWLLLNRIDGELTPEQEKQVGYIRSSSESLLELVNNLLDIAKVEAGKVTVSAMEFEVEEVLSGLRGIFRPILNNNDRVKFNVDFVGNDFVLETDQAKLSQILRNLVSNAFKFTEDGSVTVQAILENEDLVHFKVTDTGTGLEKQNLEMIFEDFSQVDSSLQKKHKGTGLGLPLSRKLARLLGGDIRVESTFGEGSTFHVLIPRVYQGAAEGILITLPSPKPIAAQTLAPANPLPLDNQQIRVLLIDDDEPSRYILRNLLNNEMKADFLEVTSGRQGIETIKVWKPHLVFLDLSMPEGDGFEVLQKLRQDPQLQKLAVIVNSAKNLTNEERMFLDKHATAYISKERTDDHQAVLELKSALSRAGFEQGNR